MLTQSLAANAAPRHMRQRLTNARVDNEAARIALRVCECARARASEQRTEASAWRAANAHKAACFDCAREKATTARIVVFARDTRKRTIVKL